MDYVFTRKLGLVMEAYLDNSATTPCLPEVTELMVKLMTMDYGNPSSMHGKGFEAEKYIKESKEIFAKNLKVLEKEIFFTSGGTESDNMAVLGAAYANQRSGKHLITTKIEHPGIKSPMNYLEEQGFEVSYLSVDRQGIISLRELKNLIRKDTILVSIMHVNNEIGSVQPIESAGKIIKECNPKCLFHVDDIQGFGKYRIYPKKSMIDLLSISGHKIHGPKGIGVLYVEQKVKMQPIIWGGGQQRGYRSGTENVPGIAGIGKATEMLYQDFEKKIESLYLLKDFFIEKLEEIPDVKVNSQKGKDSAPHIVSLSVRGIRSEVLLHTLEESGIYVSAGSACASNKPAVSETLKAIKLEKELLESTIRFSFSTFTTKEELDYTAQVCAKVIPLLRKYTRH